MRLQPIEKPKGLLMRLAYWMTRRQLGKVDHPDEGAVSADAGSTEAVV